MSFSISVCIPTYARPAYLEEATQSALNQGSVVAEVLISDDGSDPRTKAVAEKFCRKDARVRYSRNDINLGLAGNWNRCVENARGEYLILIGDDDRLLSGGLESLVAAGSADVIFGTHFLIDATGQRLEDQSKRHNEVYGRTSLKPGLLDNAESIVWRNSIPMCASVLKTRLAKTFQFKSDTNTPELILFAELAASGATFRYVDAFISEYRVHAASATSSGLWNEKLVTHLLDIPVSAKAESQKRKLLHCLLINAVSRCLESGSLREAREFANSKYYPSHLSDGRSAFQRLCLSLPRTMGHSLYRFALRCKSKVNSEVN